MARTARREHPVLDSLFSTVLSADSTTVSLSGTSFLLCSLASLILGVAIAYIYMFKHNYSKNFVVTLALLPIIVQMVISLVNGNLGAGIAVMGVFNLVRFRSIPGSAKDIGAVFLAMAVGLATGMGYLTLAVLFTVIVGIANIAFVLSPLGNTIAGGVEKTLKVTIPEDLDYCNIFDDLFDRFTSHNELVNVKTTNMGSLYQLEYNITLKDPKIEKSLLDAIRCRNGNLTVQCGRPIAKETL
jgi:type IV secretory pathway VirB2 component (pilin)